MRETASIRRERERIAAGGMGTEWKEREKKRVEGKAVSARDGRGKEAVREEERKISEGKRAA